MGLFEKLKSGLSKTRSSITKKLYEFFKRGVNDDLYDDLEELLITSDLGYDTTEKIITELKEVIKENKIRDTDEIINQLKSIIINTLGDNSGLDLLTSPSVILVIGVNGVGKTTSIGKLAYDLISKGKKVMLVAGDTFRAGAINQLQIWADRTGADIIKQAEGSDPASVVYDAINAAKKRMTDVIIVDTAGRLHNKSNLMSELAKIDRIIQRELPNSSKETLLVIDATTGQNGINQAIEFNKTSKITGIILTKLDGTAKGGIIISVYDRTSIPVKYVGVGEKIDDLQPFDPKEFVEALFDNE